MGNKNFLQNIKNLFIIPDIDNGTVKTSFLPLKKTPTVINYTISEGKNVILEGKGRIEADTGGIVTFVIKMGNFKLWELDNPVLYLLEANAKDAIIKQYFGMRKIHADNKTIYFNNRPFYMRGYIRGIKAHDHPDLTGLSLEEYYLKNILQAKKFGFNFVRWHSTVPPEEFFCIADKAGFLCQIEIGYKGDIMDKDRNQREFDKVSIDEDKWAGTILRFRNHPSLMVYCIGNEMHKSGTRKSVMEIYQKGKELDPTRLILDNCGWGEYDRKTSDFFCQHIAYFFPWNRHEDMFNEKWCFKINGSVKKHEMEQKIESDTFSASLTREPVPVRPVVAHEVGHYISLHDLKRLESKFKKDNVESPWWLGELKNLIKKKGMEEEYPLMVQASVHFQKICHKWLLERIRLSNYLVGFRFLQLSDTSYYENSNGILDCFDDEKWWTSEEFLKINSDTVLLTSSTKRVFTNGEMIEVPVFLSHYGKESSMSGNLHCFLNDRNSHLIHSTVLKDISINAQGIYKLGLLSLKFNSCTRPVKYKIRVEFRRQKTTVNNSWDIWLFPKSKEGFKRKIPSHLENRELYHKYNCLIEKSGGPDDTDEIYVTDRLTSSVIDYLGRGGRVLLLYRHSDVQPGDKERQFLFPSTLDHFKPVFWDRGHNLGGIVRKHPITDTLPHDDVIDFQFANLIEGGCKINLDAFPVRIDPIIQGIDRPVRDRMDVLIKGKRDFVPEYTMRRFGYLFEFKVGKGSMLVCTFNFKMIEMPEVDYFFREMIRYVVSSKFKPEKIIDVKSFKRYLLENAKNGIPEESAMTKFWQDDTLPVETTLFWMKAGIDFARDWKGYQG